MVGSELVVFGASRRVLHDQRDDAREAGARAGRHVICIDPYRTPTAEQADEHLMVRPGTDGALASR